MRPAAAFQQITTRPNPAPLLFFPHSCGLFSEIFSSSARGRRNGGCCRWWFSCSRLPWSSFLRPALASSGPFIPIPKPCRRGETGRIFSSSNRRGTNKRFGKRPDGMVHLTACFERYEPTEAKATAHQETCCAIIQAEIVVFPPDGPGGSAAALLR